MLNYKKIIVVLQVIFSFGLAQSCKSQQIDDIIIKYNDADFSSLKNVSIYPRSIDKFKGTTIYLIDSYLLKCSPYVVEVENSYDSILSIDNGLVIKSCGKDYFSKSKIEEVLKQYKKLNLCLIQVDNEGNVYINPNRSELPIILKKSKNSTPSNINLFKQYEGDWYVRK